MISRLFARKVRAHRPPVPRLRVEGLEAREVPATWNPVPVYDMMTNTTSFDCLASNPNNWTFGYGESISYFTTATFNSSNTNPCEDFSGNFDAININPGHTGTITLNGDLTVAMLYQGGGTIDQPLGSGSEITITEWWSWEGGTHNSTSTLSSVTFDGSLYPSMASATIAPTDGGTVSTGSTLNFISAPISVEPGTVTFTNSAATFIMDLASNATFNTALAAITFVQDNPAPDNWTVISNAIYSGGAGPTTFPTSVRVTGRVSLAGSATVNCNGGAANGDASIVTAAEGAVGRGIYITSGSTLKAAHKVIVLAGGTIAAVRSGGIANTPNNGVNLNLQRATIDGTLVVEGGSISISDQVDNTHYWGILRVTGDLEWSGGVLRVTVDAGNNGNADLLSVGGKAKITTNGVAPPTFSVTVANGNLANAITYPVIKANMGFEKTGANYPSAGASYTVSTSGDPVNTWNLVSVV
jgi:hypothetical protein